MRDLNDLGLPTSDACRRKLALDPYLQLAGLEDIAGLSVDISRLGNELLRDRNTAVLKRLENLIDLGELTVLGEGDGIPISAIEERAPHVSVLMVYETTRAVAALWPAFLKAAQEAGSDGTDE